MSPDSVSVASGVSTQLSVVLRASDNSIIAGRPVTYRSLNAAVATVTLAGVVKTLEPGTTSVVVSAGSVSRAVMVRSTTVAVVPPVTPPISPPTPPAVGANGLNAALNARTLFPASNAWNQPVDTAPVDPNSNAIISNIGLTKSFHPDFGASYNGGPFGIPYIVVSGAQAGVNVTFDYDDESDHGLYPIPANAPVEGGAAASGDRHVLVVDRDHHQPITAG
ncbi:MAG: Ig-like domain-containing protein [Gemmatimonadota bacterium]|nr:Ig-like domain-containing protein [Gemmatimonadota bacterium]